MALLSSSANIMSGLLKTAGFSYLLGYMILVEVYIQTDSH